MKAIRLENKNFKVVSEKGVFIYYENEVKKIKVIQAELAVVVECEEKEIFVSKFHKSNSLKKVNEANFMSKEDFSKSKYGSMSNEEFERQRNIDKWGSKSL